MKLETLIADLDHPVATVRAHAAALIGWMGPAGKPAVGALIKMLSRQDPRDRKMAALALGNIGPAAREALPVLLGVAHFDHDPSVQQMAAEACQDISRQNPEAA
ncbi:MAG: hypothetical protein KatS3mg105_0547 [Gemmatales bacterium]|nr:MAG: hypothetical protein KatS3mg105_0547 [Gemmatales bacterium]